MFNPLLKTHHRFEGRKIHTPLQQEQLQGSGHLYDCHRQEDTGVHSFIHTLTCAECDDSLLFSGASSTPICCVLFPSTPFCQLVFQLSSLRLAIYFSVYLLHLLFPNLYVIHFWEFCFLPFSVYAQTNVMYLALFQIYFSV